VQLPRDMVEQHRMRDRVLLESEADHISVWPDRPDGPDRADGADHANGQHR
jgi:hypothetical protein